MLVHPSNVNIKKIKKYSFLVKTTLYKIVVVIIINPCLSTRNYTHKRLSDIN